MKIHYDVTAASLIFGDVISITKEQVNKSSMVTLKVGEEPVPEFIVTKNKVIEPIESKIKAEYDEDIMTM